jgi:hypothetical protein
MQQDAATQVEELQQAEELVAVGAGKARQGADAGNNPVIKGKGKRVLADLLSFIAHRQQQVAGIGNTDLIQLEAKRFFVDKSLEATSQFAVYAPGTGDDSAGPAFQVGFLHHPSKITRGFQFSAFTIQGAFQRSNPSSIRW